MQSKWIVFGFFLIWNVALGQTEEGRPFFRFKNLTEEENSPLHGQDARCFFQDSKGLLWIGKFASFAFYDGNATKEYTSNSTLSPDDLFCTAITEDHTGNIWVYANGSMMHRLDRKKDRITSYKIVNNFRTSLFFSRDYHRCMFEDKNKRLWVSTLDGIQRFNYKTKQFQLIEKRKKDDTGWIFEDHTGRLWQVLTHGICSFYHKEKKYLPFVNDRGISVKIGVTVSRVIEDKAGNFWISTNGEGLYKFDSSTKSITQYSDFQNRANDLSFEWAVDITEDDDGRIWICNDMGGLAILATKTNELFKYNADINPLNNLTSKPFVVYKDKNSGIWLSHFLAGVSYLGQSNKHFKNYLAPSDAGNFPFVYQGFERRDGNIWLSTRDNGIFLWDRKQDSFKHYPIPLAKEDEGSGGLSENIVETENGMIWFLKGGLYRYDLNTKQSKKFKIFGGLYLDKKGILWLTNLQGIHRYDPDSEIFKLILPDLLGIFEDKQGNYWVGTEKGWCKYNFDTKKTEDCIEAFNVHAKFIYEFNKFKANAFSTSLAEDSKGNFWILLPRQGDTIVQYNPRNQTFTDTIFLENITDYRKNWMEVDANDQVWIGTPVGIYKYNPNIKKLTRYTEMDGLATRHSCFSPFVLKTSNGELLYGHSKGFTIFHPSDIVENQVTPPVLITGFKIQDQAIPIEGSPEDTFSWKSPLKQHIHFTQSITLQYWQNDFSLEFAALNYNNPRKNKYKYKLLGYDDHWYSTDANSRVAKYTNLSPGRYTFHVIATNNDGVWNYQGDTMAIRILPPWWSTWWASILWAGLGLNALYFIGRYEFRRRLANAEAKRLLKLDFVKSRLYTNISHEFRTPLTAIIGIAEYLQTKAEETTKSNLAIIHRNGLQLLELVNQLLDLSKVESGSMKLKTIQGDILTYLHYLVESFQSMAERKNIYLNFSTKLSELNMDFDPLRLQQVISNLLSNAIKFTSEKGEVHFFVEKQGECLEIKVEDNGIGIPEEKLSFVFDRFFQVDDTSIRQGEGTGIGLALTKELVMLMGGEITVSSIPGAGSQFTVLLPIKQTSLYQSSVLETSSFKQPPSPSMHEMVHQNEDLQAPLLLIVEDNQDVVKYLLTCLSPSYRIELAYNGQQGIEKAIELTPDLIISDVMMPEKDGFELCHVLKTNVPTSHIPIILLTAKADIESKLNGLQHGADAYLSKPFNKDELLAHIKNLLQIRKQLHAYYLAQLSLSVGDQISLPAQVAPEIHLEHAFIEKIKTLIEADLSKQWQVPELAQLLHVSISQLHRKLEALTGMHTTEFVRFVRLNKASKLLDERKDEKILSIAYEVGFSSPNEFTRRFKEVFKMTPGEWSKRNK